MTRRFQFSLRALLVAMAFIATGVLLVRLAIHDREDLGFMYSEGAAACFGAAAGLGTKRPLIGAAIGAIGAELLFGGSVILLMAAAFFLGY